LNQNTFKAGCRWLTPVILATQEAEIRKIVFQSQPGQIEKKNPSPKRAGGLQGVGPEFKLQYHKNKTKQHFQFFFPFLGFSILLVGNFLSGV
jgi:hypothetical protein